LPPLRPTFQPRSSSPILNRLSGGEEACLSCPRGVFCGIESAFPQVPRAPIGLAVSACASVYDIFQGQKRCRIIERTSQSEVVTRLIAPGQNDFGPVHLDLKIRTLEAVRGKI